MSPVESPSPLVPRRPGLHLHPLRSVLHGCTWVCLGRSRRDRAARDLSRRDRRTVLRQVRATSWRPLQLDREAWRRLYLLGQGRWLHGLSSPSPPVPNLAILARECRDAGRLGSCTKSLSRVWQRPAVYSDGDPNSPLQRPTMSEINPGPASENDSRLIRAGYRASRICTNSSTARWRRLGPICQLSGRCCRFQEYGHTLFVSSLEVQFLLDHAPEPERPAGSRADLPLARRPESLHGAQCASTRMSSLFL